MKEPIEILKEKIKKAFKDCVFEMEIEELDHEGFLHVIFKIDDRITFEAQASTDWSLENPKKLLYAYDIYYCDDEGHKETLCPDFVSGFMEDKQVLKAFSIIKNKKKQEFYEIIGALKELGKTIKNIRYQERALIGEQLLNC